MCSEKKKKKQGGGGDEVILNDLSSISASAYGVWHFWLACYLKVVLIVTITTTRPSSQPTTWQASCLKMPSERNIAALRSASKWKQTTKYIQYRQVRKTSWDSLNSKRRKTKVHNHLSMTTWTSVVVVVNEWEMLMQSDNTPKLIRYGKKTKQKPPSVIRESGVL